MNEGKELYDVVLSHFRSFLLDMNQCDVSPITYDYLKKKYSRPWHDLTDSEKVCWYAIQRDLCDSKPVVDVDAPPMNVIVGDAFTGEQKDIAEGC
jgi:hypothetical protein